ncbi:MAG: hypothetical protein HYX48_02545 [Chlamydiales bacterium]|nr:hypothetical protein [Chlamydiales bacterium]
MSSTVHTKANRVLNLILVALLLVLIRVWYLGTVQHDQHLELARRPQRRVVIENVERATIRDRFNIPLAINTIQYNISVSFAQIRQIPSVVWKKDDKGKWVKTQARMAYVAELSKFLATELGLTSQEVEDAIIGRASLFPHTPFVIKEDVSEKEYYRLKALEKDWPGMQARRSSKRFYPRGKVGCDVLGYLGPISEKEYVAIAQEIEELQTYLTQREAGELVPLPQGYETPLEVRKRLKELKEKAYTINDLVGKSGIESAFDQNLRGACGKKMVEVDVKGNFIRQLPGGRRAKPGERILLSISAELQEFAEMLLAQHEPIRDKKNQKGEIKLDYPWIKGGAIVALHPKTGEVLALASYPRFNPNDFVPSQKPESKQKKESDRLRWLESESYAGEIWDGKRPLEREVFDSVNRTLKEETLALNWERYLELILPSGGSVRSALDRLGDLSTCVRLQKELDTLLLYSAQDEMATLIDALYDEEGHSPSRLQTKGGSSEEAREAVRARCKEKGEIYESSRKWIDYYLASIPKNDDKLLLIDLAYLMAKKEEFSPQLLEAVGGQNLSTARALCQAAISTQLLLKPYIQELYHDIDFNAWRRAHFKEFLKAKRREEKESRRYTRPYTEYLQQLERGLFKEFWEKNRWLLVQTFILGKTSDLPTELQPYVAQILELRKEPLALHSSFGRLKELISSLPHSTALSYLQTMHSFQELSRPLFGSYRHLRNAKGKQLEKHLAAAFYPLYGFSYGRSQAFRQPTPLGSVFKIVTAYEALRQRHQTLSERVSRDLNPLTLVDDLKWDANKNTSKQILGYTLSGEPIRRLYKGGQLPRSSHSHIGRIDVTGALEQSSNIYFAILAGEHLEDPEQLAIAARGFGFGQTTGIELPGEVGGSVPSDLSYNRTGLYSFAIGQHSLVVTPLQTAVMAAAVANGGQVLQPKIVKAVAGKEATYEEESPFESSEFSFKEELALVGISFPFFVETQKEQIKSFVSCASTEVKQTVSLPDEVRNLLLEGMHRVIAGQRGTARPAAVSPLIKNPQVMRDYVDLQHCVVGKTGTPEILYKHTIDAESEADKIDHVWFTGISFHDDAQHKKWEEPELVVVVMLRFGEKGGREPAPLAIQMIKKWREISARSK